MVTNDRVDGVKIVSDRVTYLECYIDKLKKHFFNWFKFFIESVVFLIILFISYKIQHINTVESIDMLIRASKVLLIGLLGYKLILLIYQSFQIDESDWRG